MSSLNYRQIGRIGPGDDVRRNAGPVGRRHLDPRLEHRNVVGGMAADDGDAGRVLARLVVGRPIDRAALQEAEANAVPLEDDRRARGGKVGARARVLNSELVQAGDRRLIVRIAIVHVVGDADGMNACKLQRFAPDRWVREETFIADRMPRRCCQTRQHSRLLNTTSAWRSSSMSRANGALGSVTFIEVHVTGEDHPQRHRTPLTTRTSSGRVPSPRMGMLTH